MHFLADDFVNQVTDGSAGAEGVGPVMKRTVRGRPVFEEHHRVDTRAIMLA